MEKIICKALKKNSQYGMTNKQIMSLLCKKGYNIDLSLTIYLLFTMEQKGMLRSLERRNTTTKKYEKIYIIF